MSMDDVPTPFGTVEKGSPIPPKTQIANQIRAAILTGKLAPGDALPGQEVLKDHYDVTRSTVKAGLDILKTERLIVMSQGGPTKVRAHTQRAVELRPHIEAAFEQPNVVIDFAGFSSETLRGAISEPLDKIRVGRFTPDSIAMRLLITDMARPTAIPTLADSREDDPKVRERATKIQARSVGAVVDQVHELEDLGLVPSAKVDVRVITTTATFKLYIINRVEVFYGFYPVVERTVSVERQPTEIYDLMGKDVPLFHYEVSDEDSSNGSQFVDASQQWFDTWWTTVAKEYQE